MKKVLCCILIFTLLFSISIMAYAANPTSGSTTITTTVEPKYTVLIPADTTIVYGATSSSIGSINVTSLQLETGKQLVISTTPSGTLKNSADASKTISYALKCDNTAFSSAAFTSTGSKALTVEITSSAWNAAVAGSYSDTITFAFTCVNIS